MRVCMMNEQHTCIFYAQKSIYPKENQYYAKEIFSTESNFHRSHGFRDGIRHGMLQHRNRNGRYEQPDFSHSLPWNPYHVAYSNHTWNVRVWKACDKACFPFRDPGQGQPNIHNTRHFHNDCMPYVPYNEPHRSTALRSSRFTGCRRMAPEAYTQLPYGAVLAGILRRTWSAQFL